MIGFGVTTASPRHWDDDATGGHIESYSYCYRVEKPAAPDPRKDPKMWALWFREFLSSIFPGICKEIVLPMEPILPSRLVRCRSGTLPVREWKMKNWVQALKSQ